MKPRRPVAIALATSAFYAGIFVTNAHAEMHYVRVTLTTGQQTDASGSTLMTSLMRRP